jgi:acetate kinase
MTSERMSQGTHVLTINSGSSSIKFAMYDMSGVPQRIATGQVERIGLPDARFRATAAEGQTHETIAAANHDQAVDRIIAWLDLHGGLQAVVAVGHRIVHGGDRFLESTAIDDAVIRELHRLAPLAPNHLPGEIAAIEAIRNRCPGLLQFGCFDTAFHRDLPRDARLIAVPRRYEAAGVRRYGFHGLSYQYLMRELERIAGSETAHGRIILAHLGAGCSLAAVKGGQCIDTTMGFTPAAGLVMATRTGDLDPGLLVHLIRTEQLSADALEALVNRQSGLLGVSETSSDLRDLLAAEPHDPRAAEAVSLFCYQLRKWIGAYSAALEGLDTLVFSAGIGENSAVIRERVCAGLRYLGIELEPEANKANADAISHDGAPVTVRVIRTDEESMIVAEVVRMMAAARTATTSLSVSTQTPGASRR